MNATLYSTFAYADAVHDFKHVAIANKEIIEEGLPKKPYTFLFSPLKDIEHVVRGIASKRSYDISVLDTSDPDAMFLQLKGDARSFGIVSDALFAKPILDILATSHLGPFYFIQNIETWNDAGQKLPEPYLLSIPNLRLLHDDPTQTNVTYHGWSSDHPDYEYKFCSIYTYTLKYSPEGPTMTVHLGDRYINDHGNLEVINSKNKIKEYINNTVSTVEKSTAFQRKRAGDWMQILSCKDMQRVYKNTEGSVEKVDDIPIYFCTTDNVAIGYALALGINTLFYNTTDRVIYMYNAHHIPYSPAVTAPPIPPDHLQRLYAVYDRVHDVYLHELQKIHRAVTNEDVKHALRYAFVYAELKDLFDRILPFRDAVNAYIADPSRNLDVPSHMISWIRLHASRVGEMELDHDLDNLQVLFPPFDAELPSGRKIEDTYAPIDTSGRRPIGKHELGCMQHLNHLYRREGVLHDFVITCIKKIIEHSVGNIDIQTFYTTYLQTKGIDLTHIQHGGDAPSREASYVRIYTLLMEYLNDDTIEYDDYGRPSRPSSETRRFVNSVRIIFRETHFHIGGGKIFNKLVLEILRRSSIPPTEYIHYVNALDEELYAAFEPLLSDTPFASEVIRIPPMFQVRCMTPQKTPSLK